LNMSLFCAPATRTELIGADYSVEAVPVDANARKALEENDAAWGVSKSPRAKARAMARENAANGLEQQYVLTNQEMASLDKCKDQLGERRELENLYMERGRAALKKRALSEICENEFAKDVAAQVKATFNSGGTIYVAADLNGDGIIDEEEEAALVKQYQALGQDLRQAYDLFSSENTDNAAQDGGIDASELSSLLEMVGIRCTEKEAKKIIQMYFDENSDGSLAYHEFLEIMEKFQIMRETTDEDIDDVGDLEKHFVLQNVAPPPAASPAKGKK